ncbi:MAG: PriCT-2 domain-containing protein, partial [Singulisphaera sp.]
APTRAMSPLASVRPRTPSQVGDVALAESALRHLGPRYYDDYSGWLTVGMALSGLGADGLDLWRAWSEQSEDKYDADDLDAKWASFGRDADDEAGRVVSLGTLFTWPPWKAGNIRGRAAPAFPGPWASRSISPAGAHAYEEDVMTTQDRPIGPLGRLPRRRRQQGVAGSATASWRRGEQPVHSDVRPERRYAAATSS